MKILVVVPAFNERESIEDTIKDLYENAPEYDYVIVNDGSSDDTKELCAQKGLHVINLPVNLGLTGAVRAGFMYAVSKGYDAAVQFDGDGQHEAKYISKLVEQMEKTGDDIVIGSRYVDATKGKGLRQFGGGMISAFIKLTTHKRVTDPTSGMRLYSRKVLEKYANHINYAPEPDTIALLMNHGVNVSEVQVEMRPRLHGKSYLSSFNAIKYMLKTTLSILLIQWLYE